eukprot:2103840-Pleurochrysis_carterae.AAC.1
MRVERGLYRHIARRSVISQLGESPSAVAVILQRSGALTLTVSTSGLPSGADATPGGLRCRLKLSESTISSTWSSE